MRYFPGRSGFVLFGAGGRLCFLLVPCPAGRLVGEPAYFTRRSVISSKLRRVLASFQHELVRVLEKQDQK